MLAVPRNDGDVVETKSFCVDTDRPVERVLVLSFVSFESVAVETPEASERGVPCCLSTLPSVSAMGGTIEGG